MAKSKFSRIVKKHRKKLKNAGFSPATIHSWEHGTLPFIDKVPRLASILDVPESDIPY